MIIVTFSYKIALKIALQRNSRPSDWLICFKLDETYLTASIFPSFIRREYRRRSVTPKNPLTTVYLKFWSAPFYLTPRIHLRCKLSKRLWIGLTWSRRPLVFLNLFMIILQLDFKKILFQVVIKQMMVVYDGLSYNI